jgi:putative membrane protein
MEFISGLRRNSEPVAMVKAISLAAVFTFFAVPMALAAGFAPKEFIKNAMEGNLAEVQVGRLAQQKAASPEVKEFGARLERDHAAANAKAEQVAQSLRVKRPTKPGAAHKQMYHELSVFSGQAFDRQFIQNMVQDHQEDIAKYEKAAKSGGPVAQYAEKVLPDLRKHLQIAEHLQETLKTVKADSSSK